MSRIWVPNRAHAEPAVQRLTVRLADPAAVPGSSTEPAPDRRHFLYKLGGLLAGAVAGDSFPTTAAAAAPATGACVLTPQATEGPFYVDETLMRSDIREDRPGQPLRLRIRLVDTARGCVPVAGALVSLWQCDAQGLYSGTGEGRDAAANRAARFLRGTQRSDVDGWTEFSTIYPGWYVPRAVHIHAKILIGKSELLTTQFYLPDTLNSQVLGSHPAYRDHGAPRMPTSADPIAGRVPNYLNVRTLPDGNGALQGDFTVGIARG